LKILLDTSVLVAGILPEHSRHLAAFPWLQKAISGERQGLVCAHTLAEMFAVLTRLPLKPKIPPATAWRLIRENVERHCQIISLSALDYKAVLQSLAELGL